MTYKICVYSQDVDTIASIYFTNIEKRCINVKNVINNIEYKQIKMPNHIEIYDKLMIWFIYKRYIYSIIYNKYHNRQLNWRIPIPSNYHKMYIEYSCLTKIDYKNKNICRHHQYMINYKSTYRLIKNIINEFEILLKFITKKDGKIIVDYYFEIVYNDEHNMYYMDIIYFKHDNKYYYIKLYRIRYYNHKLIDIINSLQLIYKFDNYQTH